MHHPRTIHTADLPVTPEPRPARDWVALLRPRQWIKNLVVFAGLLFSAGFRQPAQILTVMLVFFIFCALSSAGYIINDLLDRQSDRLHPAKRGRPLAAGRLRPAAAGWVATALLAGGLGGAALLGWPVAAVSAAYLALSVSYSWLWKHRVILDLMAIAGGFLLRALAGTVALGIALSPWLFVCVSFLALLLGFGKRRHEVSSLGEDAANHRPVLAHYSPAFTAQMVVVMAASAIITYAIYAISSPTAVHHPALVYTTPLVLYAVLRYVYLVHHGAQSGQPEEIFLTDRPMAVTILLWGLAIVGIFLWG